MHLLELINTIKATKWEELYNQIKDKGFVTKVVRGTGLCIPADVIISEFKETAHTPVVLRWGFVRAPDQPKCQKALQSLLQSCEDFKETEYATLHGLIAAVQ